MLCYLTTLLLYYFTTLLYYTTLLLYYTTLLIHFFTYTPGTIERPWRAAQLGHRIAEECQKVREVYYYTSLLPPNRMGAGP